MNRSMKASVGFVFNRFDKFVPIAPPPPFYFSFFNSIASSWASTSQSFSPRLLLLTFSPFLSQMTFRVSLRLHVGQRNPPAPAPMGPNASPTGKGPTTGSLSSTTSCLQCWLFSSASPWKGGLTSSTMWVLRAREQWPPGPANSWDCNGGTLSQGGRPGTTQHVPRRVGLKLGPLRMGRGLGGGEVWSSSELFK